MDFVRQMSVEVAGRLLDAGVRGRTVQVTKHGVSCLKHMFNSTSCDELGIHTCSSLAARLACLLDQDA